MQEPLRLLLFPHPVQEGCILPQEDVERTLRAGAALGCTEALFTFGEHPEEEPGFPEMIRCLGYISVLDYCEAMCRKSIGYGVLPHTNAGILTYGELDRLRAVNASMGLMLETTAEIPAHATSTGKDPATRLAMMEDAGKLRIPFTTGLLLGIGETMADREDSFFTIRDLHRRYGHIQEVIIQNFCPKPGTPLGRSPAPGTDGIVQRSGWRGISSSRRSLSRSRRTSPTHPCSSPAGSTTSAASHDHH